LDQANDKGDQKVNLKNRALHVTVLASMVGAMGAVVAPAAHAAALPPDSCGVLIQGGVDPLGGLLPVGAIPAPVGVNTAGQNVYVLRGHEAKGQDKILSDLNNTAPGAKNFSLGVVVNNAPVGVGDTQTSVKIAQKIDTNTGKRTLPTIQVSQVPSKRAVIKGTISQMAGADKFGATTGNKSHVVPGGSEQVNLVIPSSAAGADTFKLSMSFPSPLSLAFGASRVTANIAANASAATIQSALQAGFATVPGGAGITVTGSAMVPGTSNGSFVINDSSMAVAIPVALALPIPSLPALPPLSALATDQSLGLQAAQLDDGSITAGLRYGGVDPAIDPIVDFGNGVYVAQGIYSSGPLPAVGLKNIGKTSFPATEQALFLQYPVSAVNLTGPNVPIALGLLGSIVGPNLPITSDSCDVLGVLGLFCGAASASIPPAFAGICGLLA